MSIELKDLLITLIVLVNSGCVSDQVKAGADAAQCHYEITAQNYDEERPDCRGIIASEHYEEVVRLRNRDALLSARALDVPYEEIALVALLNGSPDHYCLKVFGNAPADPLADGLQKEDMLLDCSAKKVPRVSVSAIELAPEGGFRVSVTYDCGLTGRCQSSWSVFVSRDEAGNLIVTNRELEWIT